LLNLFKELIDLTLLLKASFAVIDHKGPLGNLFLKDNPKPLSAFVPVNGNDLTNLINLSPCVHLTPIANLVHISL